MQEVYKLLVGIVILLIGIPIGNILAKNTREELKDGKKWFYLIILISVIGAIINLIFLNDVLLFTFLFIAIVTSRSLRTKKKKLNIKKKVVKKKKTNKKRR
jgi:Na+/melibiose symporter-like transporter